MKHVKQWASAHIVGQLWRQLWLVLALASFLVCLVAESHGQTASGKKTTRNTSDRNCCPSAQLLLSPVLTKRRAESPPVRCQSVARQPASPCCLAAAQAQMQYWQEVVREQQTEAARRQREAYRQQLLAKSARKTPPAVNCGQSAIQSPRSKPPSSRASLKPIPISQGTSEQSDPPQRQSLSEQLKAAGQPAANPPVTDKAGKDAARPVKADRVP